MPVNDNERFMDLAIEEAQRSLRAGNSGFGAVLVRDGEVISSAHDTDKSTGDPTAHAELRRNDHMGWSRVNAAVTSFRADAQSTCRAPRRVT